jgi:hypothetical protein
MIPEADANGLARDKATLESTPLTGEIAMDLNTNSKRPETEVQGPAPPPNTVAIGDRHDISSPGVGPTDKAAPESGPLREGIVMELSTSNRARASRGRGNDNGDSNNNDNGNSNNNNRNSVVRRSRNSRNANSTLDPPPKRVATEGNRIRNRGVRNTTTEPPPRNMVATGGMQRQYASTKVRQAYAVKPMPQDELWQKLEEWVDHQDRGWPMGDRNGPYYKGYGADYSFTGHNTRHTPNGPLVIILQWLVEQASALSGYE